jgi:hypothetical protein
MLAIVSGSFATAGVVGRYAEKLSDNRSFSSKTTLDRDALVNAEVWHYVARVESLEQEQQNGST